ncbi:hypothetical protein GQ53DRAFT_885553 [Thozetella sp. PMI_491]|nr:hypothetical protein GQ53DRAFT_885553 [Thozetella sp. PMI_491]
MAEVAGLVLGGIPLAIWALEKYAEPFEAYHRYRISIENLQTDLSLQKQHLQLTLTSVGLETESPADDFRECFETNFPSVSRELMLIRNTFPDKAEWEWSRVKHSFSTKKRKKLIDDLRRWNEDLRRSLERSEMPTEDDTPKVQGLIRRFNIRRCDAIRHSLGALHRALQSSFRCACSTPHQASIYLDWQTYSDAEKPYNMAISYATTSQAMEPTSDTKSLQLWRKVDVTAPSISVPPTPPAVETPAYSIPAPPADTEPEIANLCNSLCADRGPWALNGYLRDPIEEHGIAASIAWSVLHLSNSPWLEECWDQQQISIFLEKSINGREILSHHPCASSIFSSPSSRITTPVSESDRRLVPNKVIFALGILLVELGTNKSLAEVSNRGDDAPTTSLFEFQQNALGKLDEVYRLAGDSYGYAAERCIKCSFQGQNLHKDFGIPNFRRQFYHTVVAPVQATYLEFPGSHSSI